MKYAKIPKLKNINSERTKKAKTLFKRVFPVLVILSIITAVAIWIATMSHTSKAINYIFQTGPAVRSTDGRVNILLLGNAGGLHDGAYLTDTILVGSYDIETNKAYLFSLPRDFWVESTKSKLNAVYEIGERENKGLEFNKAVVGDILGMPIHYAVRIDFRGFVKAIDQIGGIDVIVDNSFDDYNYPIEGRENDLCGFTEEEIDFDEEKAKELNIEPGIRKVFIAPDGKIATDSADPKKGPIYFSCRFERISFKKGEVHMDGEAALKFVRSRMGTSGEGSDFARSKRQQKVIDAARKKVLSLEILTSPQKITGLIDTFGKSVETDVSATDAFELYKLVNGVESTQSFVLDDSSKLSLLMSPPSADYGGAYVLIPKDNSLDAIHLFVRQALLGEVISSEASASARTSN